MAEPKIDERVRELREKRVDWQKEPCGDTWREWSVACTDHMPAILDALEQYRTFMREFFGRGPE